MNPLLVLVLLERVPIDDLHLRNFTDSGLEAKMDNILAEGVYVRLDGAMINRAPVQLHGHSLSGHSEMIEVISAWKRTCVGSSPDMRQELLLAPDALVPLFLDELRRSELLLSGVVRCWFEVKVLM
jgi:hypothetical protein